MELSLNKSNCPALFTKARLKKLFVYTDNIYAKACFPIPILKALNSDWRALFALIIDIFLSNSIY
jgi:hypothetical protein